MTQAEISRNIQLCEDPFILCRFSNIMDTVHTTVLPEGNLPEAKRKAEAIVADDEEGVWNWSYLFRSGKVVADIEGPACIGASYEFVVDFHSKSKPVYLDITKGDALES